MILLYIKSEAKVNFVGQVDNYPFSSDGFLSGAKNYPLHKAMVDHDQQRIKTRGSGGVSDKVTRDLLEGAQHMGLDRSEWRSGGVCI